MDIGWFRDLVIAILGIMVIIAAISNTMMVLFLYKRMRVALDRIEAILKRGDTLSSDAEKALVGPLIQIAALTQGIYQTVTGIVTTLHIKRR